MEAKRAPRMAPIVAPARMPTRTRKKPPKIKTPMLSPWPVSRVRHEVIAAIERSASTGKRVKE